MTRIIISQSDPANYILKAKSLDDSGSELNAILLSPSPTSFSGAGFYGWPKEGQMAFAEKTDHFYYILGFFNTSTPTDTGDFISTCKKENRIAFNNYDTIIQNQKHDHILLSGKGFLSLYEDPWAHMILYNSTQKLETKLGQLTHRGFGGRLNWTILDDDKRTRFELEIDKHFEDDWINDWAISAEEINVVRTMNLVPTEMPYADKIIVRAGTLTTGTHLLEAETRQSSQHDDTKDQFGKLQIGYQDHNKRIYALTYKDDNADYKYKKLFGLTDTGNIESESLLEPASYRKYKYGMEEGILEDRTIWYDNNNCFVQETIGLQNDELKQTTISDLNLGVFYKNTISRVGNLTFTDISSQNGLKRHIEAFNEDTGYLSQTVSLANSLSVEIKLNQDTSTPIELDVNGINNWNLKVSNTGKTTLDVADGKVVLDIDPSGKVTLTASKNIEINSDTDIVLNATGKVHIGTPNTNLVTNNDGVLTPNSIFGGSVKFDPFTGMPYQGAATVGAEA